MATGHLIIIEDYLSTVYRPDCDYVDGNVIERDFGDYNHARLQSQEVFCLYPREKDLGIGFAKYRETTRQTPLEQVAQL
jgi:hypothetical protein